MGGRGGQTQGRNDRRGRSDEKGRGGGIAGKRDIRETEKRGDGGSDVYGSDEEDGVKDGGGTGDGGGRWYMSNVWIIRQFRDGPSISDSGLRLMGRPRCHQENRVEKELLHAKRNKY